MNELKFWVDFLGYNKFSYLVNKLNKMSNLS